MRNIRKRLTALLVICLLLVQAAVPAAASEAGQERKRVSVFFEADGMDGMSGFYSDEPESVTMTARVPEDGTYLLDLFAEGGYGYGLEPVSVSSPNEALAFLNDREFDGDLRNAGVLSLVELTAGEYTIQAENACYVDADLTLVYPMESVLGPIEAGAYFGTVDEAMTVNYILTGSNAYLSIYNDTPDGMRQVGSASAVDEEYAGEPVTGGTSVSLEPGTVVIDFRDVDQNGSLEGAEADMSTNEAAVLKGTPIEFVEEGNMDGFDFSSQSVDAPATGTATIAGDGCYFLDVDLKTYAEGEAFTFSSDIPALPDLSELPEWATAPAEISGDETQIHMVTNVVSGTYSMTIGRLRCEASFFPLQTVDSLTGEFKGRNMYVCFLDEPAEVTFSMDEYSSAEVSFYGGAEEDGFLQDLTPEMEVGPDGMVEVTVQFPAGAAVIDTHSYNVDSVTGVQS